MSGNSRSNRTIIVDGAALSEVLDETMIRSVVHGFYDEIRRDELLGPIFHQRIAHAEWPAHLAKMCDFWSATLLRTARYGGRPLPPHLTIEGLGEAHFRRWLKLFRATVRRICPPDVAALFMNRALRIAHSFRLAVAFNRGETTTDIEPIVEKEL
ncbi:MULTISPECIES: group III truncated hemoglobin [unclassified Mesorhizobium]|uniref:group III truncated hemoglobin n=1 Tax=unclassified Mesorhizobium TaxID=325217 RepID=UPI001126C943|nr:MULTISPECIES: group III truncated hemoglobin [unclassified Mesorhizobium]TPK97013.1 group III truncated hemoglobin [Mesorhizobium sp. B2-4-16]TPL65032.1 group III truncated hemoglobin [Mesorhizobium sp. B2-4-3]